MGGGAFRTVARAAAVGGYRAAAASQGGAWKPKAPSAVAPPAPPGCPSALSASDRVEDLQHVVGREIPDCEAEGWELAGGPEELFDALHPAPRLVFGPVPTIEEAREATSDLKDALDMAYFSNEVPSIFGVMSQASLQSSVTKASVNSGSSSNLTTTTPNHVFQAFTLLQNSSEAQNVVASLACDQNVWDAIMNNEKLIGFLENQNGHAAEAESTRESVAENGDSEECQNSCTSENPFGLMDYVKAKVSKAMDSIVEFVQDVVAAPTKPASGADRSADEGPDSGSSLFTFGASFMALAMAAILVILLKRA